MTSSRYDGLDVVAVHFFFWWGKVKIFNIFSILQTPLYKVAYSRIIVTV